MIDDLVGFSEAMAKRVLPFVARGSEANGAALGRARARADGSGRPGKGEEGRDKTESRRAVVPRLRGPVPRLQLPPPPAAPWRYPPREFVLQRRKGVRGGWVAPLALPGFERPMPAVRAQRDDIGHGGEGGADGNGSSSSIGSSTGGGGVRAKTRGKVVVPTQSFERSLQAESEPGRPKARGGRGERSGVETGGSSGQRDDKFAGMFD